MSFRYRLYPDVGQEPTMREHCGQVRLVWNIALEQMFAARSMGLRCDWNKWETETIRI